MQASGKQVINHAPEAPPWFGAAMRESSSASNPPRCILRVKIQKGQAKIALIFFISSLSNIYAHVVQSFLFQ